METPTAPVDKRYHETFEWLASRTSLRPKIAIVCGSGLGRFAETLEEPQFFEYKDIPHFPVSTVPGHKVDKLKNMNKELF
jgi:purine-nucleoside phosphorylase